MRILCFFNYKKNTYYILPCTSIRPDNVYIYFKNNVFIVTCTTQMIPEWKIHPRKKVNKYELCEEYLLVEKVITFLAYIYHLTKFT